MATNKCYYMYVLLCADHTLYTGYTTDLLAREQKHQAGKGAKYTKPQFRRPCVMLFSKAFEQKEDAMSCEYHFKRLKRSEKEAVLRAVGVTQFTMRGGISRVDLGRADAFFEEWAARRREKHAATKELSD